ncbi:MAG: RNA polymerase sigma factor, partial [Planctomycetota bacterium]
MEQTTNKTSDVELFKRFCSGEESAFQELVERYRNSLYMFLSQFLNQRDLVEDVFQETFLQLYVSRDS